MKNTILIVFVLAISMVTAHLVALATANAMIIGAVSTIAAGISSGLIEKHLA